MPRDADNSVPLIFGSHQPETTTVLFEDASPNDTTRAMVAISCLRAAYSETTAPARKPDRPAPTNGEKSRTMHKNLNVRSFRAVSSIRMIKGTTGMRYLDWCGSRRYAIVYKMMATNHAESLMRVLEARLKFSERNLERLTINRNAASTNPRSPRTPQISIVARITISKTRG